MYNILICDDEKDIVKEWGEQHLFALTKKICADKISFFFPKKNYYISIYAPMNIDEDLFI